MLWARFLPANFEQILYQQYHHCQQGHRSINKNTKEFYRLGAQVNLNENEGQLGIRYMAGLIIPIQEKIELSPVWSLSDTINLSSRLKNKLRGKQLRHHLNGDH